MAVKKAKEIMIVNKRSQKALQARGTENGTAVTQTEPLGLADQIWMVEKHAEGSRIVHKASGKALDLILGGTESGTGLHIWELTDAPTQVWKITGGISRKVVSISAGKALDIPALSDEDGATAQIWEDLGGENQRWRFVALEEPEGIPTVKKTRSKAAASSRRKKIEKAG